MWIDHLRIADTVEGLDHVTLRDLRLDFFAEPLSSRNRGIRDAIHGAGGMGDRAGALK